VARQSTGLERFSRRIVGEGINSFRLRVSDSKIFLLRSAADV
jgi:hypothetical protein